MRAAENWTSGSSPTRDMVLDWKLFFFMFRCRFMYGLIPRRKNPAKCLRIHIFRINFESQRARAETEVQLEVFYIIIVSIN